MRQSGFPQASRDRLKSLCATLAPTAASSQSDRVWTSRRRMNESHWARALWADCGGSPIFDPHSTATVRHPHPHMHPHMHPHPLSPRSPVLNTKVEIHVSSRHRRAGRATGIAAGLLALVASTCPVFPAAAQGPAGARGTAEAGGERRGPPQEAVAACATLAAGNGCNFKHNGLDLKGQCWAPQGKPLACKPQGRSAAPGAGASAPRR